MSFNKTLLASAVASAMIFSGAANASYSAFAGGILTESVDTGGLSKTELDTSVFLGPALAEAGWTLSSVVITETATLNIDNGSSVTNTAAQAQSFLLGEDSLFNHTTADATLNAELAFFLDPSYKQAYNNLAPNILSAFGPATKTATASTGSLTAGSDFALFAVGGAGANVTVKTVTSTSQSGGGGNLATNFVTNALDAYSVTFTYTKDVVTTSTVPEPASLALLAAGIAGLGFRRNKKA